MTKNIKREKISPETNFFEAKRFEANKNYTELRMRVHTFTHFFLFKTKKQQQIHHQQQYACMHLNK